MFQLPIWCEVFERMNNFRWEVQIGISTGGIVEIDKPDSTHYASIDYLVIHKVLPENRLSRWLREPQHLDVAGLRAACPKRAPQRFGDA